MISEDYVSFKTAKLLKDKGLDVPCLAHWFIGNEAHEKFSDYPFNWNEVKNDLDWLSRPTQQMAMKWLREVHNIDIFPWRIGKGIYSCAIFNSTGQDLSSGKDFLSEKYEETVDEAIFYCLQNLI